MKQSTSPKISVIVPVRNAPDLIRSCVKRIQKSDYPDYELIVVDDASTDNTPEVLEELGVRVLRLDQQSGPARARNYGVKEARGEYVFFIDADVWVYPDTIRKVVKHFESRPEVDALFGSYDVHPRAGNFISQYRNLFHHFVHQQGKEEASTFWSGCGAIKREVFLEMDGFDVNYQRPCIEDIELGARLTKAGHRISLCKHIQVSHLKKWTFWGMLKADVRDRGIPWTELIMREKNLPNDLNLKLTQRISALFSFGILGSIVMEALSLRELFLMPLFGILSVLFLDIWSLKRRVPTAVRILIVLIILAGIVAAFYYQRLWLIMALLLTIGIVVMNFPFYSFFLKEKYPLFAVMVIPLHILYYLYSMVAFVIGVTFYLWKNKISRLFHSQSVKTQGNV